MDAEQYEVACATLAFDGFYRNLAFLIAFAVFAEMIFLCLF